MKVKILLVIPVLILGAVGYAVIRPGGYGMIKPATYAESKPVASDQTGVLQELSTVLHKMDTLTVLTIEGTITARDLADSTRNMETTFCYTRNGQEAYYRVGRQEMISLQNAYIVVAHDIHKVFLSPPREVVNPMKLSVGKEATLLAEEGYAITRSVNEAGVHISLLNHRHPTCRAYDITFDSTGWIKQTYMRVTDEAHPIDTTRDKFIGIRISSCKPGVVRKELLNSNRYIKISNGLAVALSGYELIKDR
ncbi:MULTISPECIES: hypothetical protein [unclassified Chitinophaga]|uniref:hypothetical protein n=1 Tax=unclassified Chitinophaga TaxID=2619133 RepID=UPI0009CFA86A|nr:MULTISPECIES: hypothetical protein [unclassified Chitinophaga]OMP76098.1 hypothetical protein BW716_26645 [[Flexibacter] sp. ATCC 35208]WPV64269.1 hypothetical protein QQL36_20925 [Chitinophaga sp. LS1]